MSDIKFFIPKGHTIPTILELRVDDISVTYSKIDGGFEFCVWVDNKNEAVEIVEEIVAKIKSEHDDPAHFVTWRTVSIDVIEVDEYYGYVLIWWKYYVRVAIEALKAKLSQEGTTKDATSDTISRQAAIDEIEYVKAMKRTAGMTYTQHLLKNWRVAFHALNDFFAHFIHGLIPAIKIRHHQPYQEGKQDRCPHCGADMRGDNKDERFN